MHMLVAYAVIIIKALLDVKQLLLLQLQLCSAKTLHVRA
jgi:hypothetical protein